MRLVNVIILLSMFCGSMVEGKKKDKIAKAIAALTKPLLFFTTTTTTPAPSGPVKCDVIWEEKVTPLCKTKHNKVCKPDFEEKCHTEYDDECWDEPVEKCHNVKSCHTTQQNVCKTEYTIECEKEEHKWKREAADEGDEALDDLSDDESFLEGHVNVHSRHARATGLELVKLKLKPLKKKGKREAEEEEIDENNDNNPEQDENVVEDVLTRSRRDVKKKLLKKVLPKFALALESSTTTASTKDQKETLCHHHPHTKCWDEPVEKCSLVPECHTEQVQRCKKVPREVCVKVETQKCWDEPEEVCEYMRVKVAKKHCRKPKQW